MEAGAFEGRPVLFNVTTTQSLESALGRDPQPVRPSLGEQLRDSSQPAIILAVIVLAIVLLRRNMDQGRADRRGAARFAGLAFWLFLVGTSLHSHALFSHQWASEIWPLLVGATFMAVIAWGSYLAAEPLGRRVWPTMFVSSSRLLSRTEVRWRDPIIGQSVLVGIITGATTFALAGPIRRAVAAAMADAPPWLLGINTGMLQGQREALANFLDLSILLAMAVVQVLALVVVQALVRRRKLALAITLVIWVLVDGPDSGMGLGIGILVAAIRLAVLLRFGVVAFVVSWLVMAACWNARAGDWSAWYAEGALIGVGLLTALAAYGWWAATGGGTGRGRPAV